MRFTKHLVGILAFARLTIVSADAQSLLPINTQTVKKSIVFLYAADASGQVNTNAELATGFLVEMPLRTEPDKAYLVLVTARHVVDPVWACEAMLNPTAIYARLNRKTYDAAHDASGVNYVKISLVNNGQILWAKHTSDAVDAAVIPLSAPDFQTQNDVATIHIADFATVDELQHVEIGDEIVSAGLVPSLSGKKRNYPFFKFGRISNIPDEFGEMPCRDHTRPANHWYVAATLIPGNSGSPIFRVPPGNAVMRFGSSRPFLVGLQSGSLAGGEIAAMTPASVIFEIIESLKLVDANLDRGPTNNR